MTDHTPRLCTCCGRAERRFRPLIETDKGPVCASDEFCRAGTSKPMTAER